LRVGDSVGRLVDWVSVTVEQWDMKWAAATVVELVDLTVDSLEPFALKRETGWVVCWNSKAREFFRFHVTFSLGEQLHLALY
jgi:hypothetical protein